MVFVAISNPYNRALSETSRGLISENVAGIYRVGLSTAPILHVFILRCFRLEFAVPGVRANQFGPDFHAAGAGLFLDPLFSVG